MALPFPDNLVVTQKEDIIGAFWFTLGVLTNNMQCTSTLGGCTVRCARSVRKVCCYPPPGVQ